MRNYSEIMIYLFQTIYLYEKYTLSSTSFSNIHEQ